ncbi:MAG: dihydroorotate dehydrogenase-like protein [Myxococcales bacterium]
MDLTTRYLGMTLKHPLMVGASPICDDLDLVRRAEDAGTAAIVMHSLFEEQITEEQLQHHHYVAPHTETHAEAQSYLPDPPGAVGYALGPDEYLEQLSRIKQAVDVPVVGSLNGVTDHGWLHYAKLIQDAGADALELNVYYLPTDPELSGTEVEEQVIEMVRHVRSEVTIPLAVKLSPFYSSIPHFAQRLHDAGASGLVLFNRFYEPDIDVEELELASRLELSTPAELNLRLRWVAALSGKLDASLAVSGGVHDSLGALKAVMAGAHGVQVVSALLQHGPEHLGKIRDGLSQWLQEHEYESLAQAQGSMSLERCPDPTYYKRGNYLRILMSWHRDHGRP